MAYGTSCNQAEEKIDNAVLISSFWRIAYNTTLLQAEWHSVHHSVEL